MNEQAVAFYPPDFVVLGVPWPDGQVVVIASTELTRGELACETEFLDVGGWPWTQAVPTTVRYRMSAEMREWVFVVAPDYATAFTSLWKQWSPKAKGHKKIAPAPKALP